MSEEITQEDVNALNAAVFQFRAMEKIAGAAAKALSLNEKIASADARHDKAIAWAEDAEAMAVRKDAEVADRLAAAEARLSSARNDHLKQMEALRNEAAIAKVDLDKKHQLDVIGLQLEFQNLETAHNAKLHNFRSIETAAQARIDALEVGERELRETIAVLEARKAELQSEFRELLNK